MLDSRLVDRQISCPYCGESMSVVIDLSAGGQSYVEDCQVCCQPMVITFETVDDDLAGLRVDRAQ